MPIKRLFGIDPDKRIDVPTGLRGSGVTGGKGLFDEYFNQIILEIQADHVVNTESKVKASSPVEGTTYFNSGAGVFQDKNDVATVFLSGQKIVWAGLDAITADIDLSAYDNLTHDYFEGVTIAFGSQNVLLGSNQIGFLNCTSTGDLSATDSPELVINNNRTEKLTDFKTSKDLVINFQTGTTSDLDASFIRLLDDFNNGFLIKDVDLTFTMPAPATTGEDLHAGVPKTSTWYQKWIGVDFLGNIQRKLVPDIEGLADGTTAGFLVDSTNVAFADKVQVGDIIYNLSTLQQTTVKTTPTVDGNNIEVNDDIFVNNDEYKIRILSPQFDSGKIFKGRIGAAFRNSGGSFDDSTYTQIQEEQLYIEGPAWTLSTSGVNLTSITRAILTIIQVIDWTGMGAWKVQGNILISTDSDAAFDLILSGIIFKNIPGYFQNVPLWTIADRPAVARTSPGTGTIVCSDGATSTKWSLSFEVELDKKPDFAK